jgi:hypothetical protein
MPEDFVTWMGLQMSNLFTKAHVRLANGQRVASTKLCGMPFTLAQHEFVRTLHALRDLRAADIVLQYHGWMMSKQHLSLVPSASFTLMDCAVVKTQVVDRRPECLLLSST